MGDTQKLMEFRRNMNSRILNSKMIDGERGKKTYRDISHKILDEQKKGIEKLREYIKVVEKCNVHPDNIKVTNYDFGFKPFKELSIKKSTFTNLISKWCEANEKQFPENLDKVEFYYNWLFEYHVIPKLELSNQNNKIDVKIFDSDGFDKPIIYEYRIDEPTNFIEFEKYQIQFLKDWDEAENLINNLSKEQEFSSRGDVMLDYDTIETLNEIDIYECYSIHFWRFFDELFELQNEQTELFGHGTEIILRALHNRFIKKYPDAKYLHLYEKFVLEIKQQYFYIANKDKALRLDLFRNLLENGEFEGGLWHAFQHFRLDGQTMSAVFKGGGAFNEEDFFHSIKKAFFFHKFEERTNERKNNKKYKEFEVVLSNYNLTGKSRTIGFFYDPDKDLHYLATVGDR